MQAHQEAPQQATIPQQSAASDTKTTVRRIEGTPATIDLREKHNFCEEFHRVPVVHFFIGDDDDMPCEEDQSPLKSLEDSEYKPQKVRRLQEKGEDFQSSTVEQMRHFSPHMAELASGEMISSSETGRRMHKGRIPTGGAKSFAIVLEDGQGGHSVRM